MYYRSIVLLRQKHFVEISMNDDTWWWWWWILAASCATTDHRTALYRIEFHSVDVWSAWRHTRRARTHSSRFGIASLFISVHSRKLKIMNTYTYVIECRMASRGAENGKGVKMCIDDTISRNGECLVVVFSSSHFYKFISTTQTSDRSCNWLLFSLFALWTLRQRNRMEFNVSATSHFPSTLTLRG